MAVKVFVSYSHADDELRYQLERHLAQLRRGGHVEAWTDRRIPPGDDWGQAIDDALEASELVLLLVSPDFLASDYCHDVELKRALARHHAGIARVIPVIVRPCDWGTSKFAKLQALPCDAKPVTRWEDRDEAWLDVVRGIRKEVTRPCAAAAGRPASAGEPELSVFLAAATDDLDGQRGKLANQLAEQGVTVREAPRTATRMDHATAVAELLRKSDLAVHLLGPLAGRAAFDEGPESLPLLELRRQAGSDRVARQHGARMGPFGFEELDRPGRTWVQGCRGVVQSGRQVGGDRVGRQHGARVGPVGS